MQVDVDDLKQRGRAAGLDAVGVASAAPFLATREQLYERRAAGLHGGMQFTYRNPDRSTDPSQSLAGAQSLVVGARRYASGKGPYASNGPHGRVAAYARADHYAALRDSLQVIADRLVDLGWQARVLVDTNSLVDRAAAHRAGLGWYGKNSNILIPGRGSWFVIGAVVTTAELTPDETPVDDGCGGCHRCLTGCPTDAIIAAGVVDARRCLAWLLQTSGDFPREFRVALGDRLYGCDDCQEVCPQSPREVASGDEPATVNVVDLLRADDATLLARHGRWYIAQRDPRYLRRNALVVLGNVGDPNDAATRDVVRQYLDEDDAMLRSHAAWAARRLGLVDLLIDRAIDPVIAEELVAPAPASP
jgi:epoxyqueuosine reductase